MKALYPDSPGYMIPPGSVWNDIKERLLICFEIHGRQDPYQVELIIIGSPAMSGKRIVEFETINWPAVKKMIETGKMQRCTSMESNTLTKSSKP